MKESFKIKKLVLGHFDSLHKACKDICNEWDSKSIPIPLLKIIIEKAKLKPDSKDVKLFCKDYNKALNAFYKALKTTAKKMKSKRIPLTKIKEGIIIMKKSFVKGFDGKTE